MCFARRLYEGNSDAHSCALNREVNVGFSECVSSSSDRGCLENETRAIRARHIASPQ